MRKKKKKKKKNWEESKVQSKNNKVKKSININ